MPELDLVIRGGLVYDGMGTTPVAATIGVSGGTIATITADAGLTAAHTIDATGLAVAPGFIDLHSHGDFTVEEDSSATGQLTQGVTTIVTGNCGWSPFPVADLEELRSWSAFLDGSASWQWRDLQGFGGQVSRQNPAINLAPQIGHVPIRIAVLGSQRRDATHIEMGEMREHIATAARQGAWGFSTGLIYAPGSFAHEQEVAALVREAAGAGILYSTHLRDETSALLPALEEAIAAVEGTGGRLQVSHLKAMGPMNHGRVSDALALIDAANARGVDVCADVYPYTASGTTLSSRLPGWALDGGFEQLLRRLADASTRTAIHDALAARFGVDFDPAGIVLSELSAGRFSPDIGRNLVELGERLGATPAEAALRVLESHNGTVGIINHAMVESDLHAALKHPRVAIASDGGFLTPRSTGTTHPRSFGTFPRVLGRYVREQGVLGLSEAIRKATSLPAARLGLRSRGRIAQGLIADLTLFDADRIGDRATFAQPWELSTGVEHVIIAGTPVLSHGAPTGARRGRVLRRRR